MDGPMRIGARPREDVEQQYQQAIWRLAHPLPQRGGRQPGRSPVLAREGLETPPDVIESGARDQDGRPALRIRPSGSIRPRLSYAIWRL